jgi:hypothetical protein
MLMNNETISQFFRRQFFMILGILKKINAFWERHCQTFFVEAISTMMDVRLQSLSRACRRMPRNDDLNDAFL